MSPGFPKIPPHSYFPPKLSNNENVATQCCWPKEPFGRNDSWRNLPYEVTKFPLFCKNASSAFTTFCDFTEQAAGVYHREARSGKYKLTYTEAKAVCEYEGGRLATYKQLEAARKIGNWFDNDFLSCSSLGEKISHLSCNSLVRLFYSPLLIVL